MVIREPFRGCYLSEDVVFQRMLSFRGCYLSGDIILVLSAVQGVPTQNLYLYKRNGVPLLYKASRARKLDEKNLVHAWRLRAFQYNGQKPVF